MGFFFHNKIWSKELLSISQGADFVLLLKSPSAWWAWALLAGASKHCLERKPLRKVKFRRANKTFSEGFESLIPKKTKRSADLSTWPFSFFSKALRKTFCKQWVLVVIVPPLCPSSCQKQHFNGYGGWRLKANEWASKCWLSHISGWLRPDHIQGGSRWGSQALRLFLTEFYSCRYLKYCGPSIWNIAAQAWKCLSEAFRKPSQRVRKRVTQR